jgi:nucleoside-diphosphate-sugar epimerase
VKEKLGGSDEIHRKLKEGIVVSEVDAGAARPKISFAKAKELFGWKPYPLEQTVLDTVESLIALGEFK